MKPSTTTSAKPLVLVDGSSYLYRAFHALPPLTTSSGEPTGAVLGVLNMLYKLLDQYQPERIAVVFDAPGKTFRDALYAEYKSQRPPMPDALRPQVEPLLEAVDALGLPVLRIPGVEADDVIGTLAATARRNGLQTLISTSDKDLAQLVDASVTLVNTMSDTTLDPQGVKTRFGVDPAQIVDFLTLVGDASDNIPGVPGVGPKTAAKWLEQYGDLESIEAHAAELPGKAGESLRATQDRLPLYRKLVTIDCAVAVPLAPEALCRRAPDTERLRALYTRLELTKLLERRHPAAALQPPAAVPLEARYETVLTDAALERWLERVLAAKLVALDTETTGLDYMRAELVGISLAVAEREAAYIPLAHRFPGAPAQLDRDAVLARLKPWLESEAPKLGHHLKFDAHVFMNYGIALRGIEYDSMLESYVLNSTATRHDMDSVAAKYLGVQTIKYEDVVGKGAKQLRFDDVDLDTATRYAAEDADVTLRIHHKLWPELHAIPELEKLYVEIERPLVGVLTKMESCGVMVDAEMLKRQSGELAEAMAKAERAAHAAAGGPFNIGSTKQLQEVLYERLLLPVRGKTPTGQPSTAENVLQELAEEYELPRRVLEYRALAKLKSTYTDKLPVEINPHTGRIHTSYHQAVAATGRLSSSDPNLQNIPVRTPEGRRIRQAFVAPPGACLVAADYSQIELRIMAHLSGDQGLLGAFANQEDIHRATAAEVFGVPLANVTGEQRRSAKAINFGLIYGMSAFGLARQLGIDRTQAQAYVELYFERYPGVKQYMEETRTVARDRGFVTTVFGRRLYLPEIRSRNSQRRLYAERSAINAPMQGTAADIIKRAMIAVDDWIETLGHDVKLIMQVHDELVLEVAETAAEETAREVARIMESAAELTVPLRVDTGIGRNWDEAH
jgi:DNA polymerase I